MGCSKNCFIGAGKVNRLFKSLVIKMCLLIRIKNMIFGHFWRMCSFNVKISQMVAYFGYVKICKILGHHKLDIIIEHCSVKNWNQVNKSLFNKKYSNSFLGKVNLAKILFSLLKKMSYENVNILNFSNKHSPSLTTS